MHIVYLKKEKWSMFRISVKISTTRGWCATIVLREEDAMRFSKKVLAVAMSVLSVFALSFSQEVDSSAVQGASLGGYVCTVWTASDGLPGNTVTDLIQSRNGYIYIGTYEGLVRFDGIEFSVPRAPYTRTPGETSGSERTTRVSCAYTRTGR